MPLEVTGAAGPQSLPVSVTLGLLPQSQPQPVWSSLGLVPPQPYWLNPSPDFSCTDANALAGTSQDLLLSQGST